VQPKAKRGRWSFKMTTESIDEINEDIKRIYHELSIMGSQITYIKNLVEDVRNYLKGGKTNNGRTI